MPVILWHIFWIWCLRESSDTKKQDKTTNRSKIIDKNAEFMLQSLDARICQERTVVWQ